MKRLEVFTSLADAVRLHADRKPDAIAFSSPRRAVSYRELDRRTDQLATALQNRGTAHADRVAYLGKNAVEFFELLLACTKIGAVSVPVNWRLSPSEMQKVLANSTAKLLFVTTDLQQVVPEATAGTSVDETIVIGEPASDSMTFEQFLALANNLHSPFAVTPSDIAVQIYTSGTTGQPKGVMLSHRAFHFAMGYESKGWPDWSNWSDDEVVLLSPPIFHVGGLNWGLRSIAKGAHGILVEKFTPADIIHYIQSSRVTRLPLVPAMIQALLDQPEASTADFSSIRHLQYGAAAIEVDLLLEVMQVMKCKLVQTYGLSETTCGVVALNPEDHDVTNPRRLRSVGRALPGVEIAIADSSGRRLGLNEVGEILLRSPSNMSGYFNLPNETQAALDGDGWLRTGDAGYIDNDGYLFVNGRIKEMIITGGENVYPGEVENALFGHPAVKEVAVIGAPSAKWGQEVRAIVVLKEGASCDEESLLVHARRYIGGYKLPKSFRFVAELPRNAAGKVLKRQLHDRLDTN